MTESPRTVRTTIEVYDLHFQPPTSRTSLEGLPGRHDRQRSGGPPSSDESDVVPNPERACRYHRRNVAAAVVGPGDFAGVLAKDAGTVRPLARAKKNAKSAAFSAGGRWWGN